LSAFETDAKSEIAKMEPMLAITDRELMRPLLSRRFLELNDNDTRSRSRTGAYTGSFRESNPGS
jgi:hypothetical protein